MTKVVYVSDPHIGTSRAAHTTAASREALERAIYTHALKIVTTENAAGSQVVMAGDLFDKANNSERVVAAGARIAEKCFAVLSGNHDEHNRIGHITSLQLVQEMGCGDVISRKDFDSVEVSWQMFGAGMLVAMIPHHPSQELFCKTLEEARRRAMEHRAKLNSPPMHLVLHCNYDQPLVAENDAALNLTSEAAGELLDAGFTQILLGHEHNPRSDFEGRLQVLGNMHPTSFSDVSNKYLWRVNDDGSLEPELIWSEEEGSAAIEVGSPLEDIPASAQFITVTGSRGAADAQTVSLYVQAVREARPDAFMVRSVVTLKDHLKDIDIDTEAAPVLGTDIAARIATDLEGSDLKDLWTTLAKECQE